MEIRIKKEYQKIAKRFCGVMWKVGCEHLDFLDCHEVQDNRQYYDIEKGITLKWMWKEAKYWLSCYYESGHCRCDDRFLSKDDYKIWVQETGYLKRFIKAIEKFDDLDVVIEEGFE